MHSDPGLEQSGSGRGLVAVGGLHPLVAELKARTHPLMNERLERMFKGAANLLLDLSDKARSSEDRRLYLDTIRTLKLVREQVQLLFMSEFSALFRPEAERQAANNSEDGELSLKPDELLDEMIVVSNIATSVEGRCPALIWEVQCKLETARDSGIPLRVEAFLPASVCQAFRKAASALDVGGEIKLVIYKVFEHFVAMELPLFYAAMNQVFDENGIIPAHLRARRQREMMSGSLPLDQEYESALRQIAQLSPHGVGGMGRAFDAGIGSRTPFMGTVGSSPGAMPWAQPMAAPAGDEQLILRLQDALQRAPRSQGGGASWVKSVAHRMSLAGGFMDGIVSDTRLPAEARGAIEQLRLAVLKVALTDESFFASPDHPLCTLVNDLYAMSLAAPAVGGSGAVQQVGDLIREVRKQLDLPADGVISGIESTRKLQDADVASFMNWQERATERRRQAVVQRVKSVVNHEITSRLADSDVPDYFVDKLANGYGPVMCLLLARHGRESAEWKAATRRLDQVVDSLRQYPRNPDQLPPREKLLQSIERDLRQAGLSAARLQLLMDALRNAYETVDRKRTENAADAERIAEEVRRQVQEEGAGVEGEPSAELSGEVETLLRGEPMPQVNLDDALDRLFQPSVAQHLDNHTAMLATLLRPGAWFRVYAPDEDATHWLKLSSYYPQHDTAAFATFDGKVLLSLSGSRIVTDLIARRTEPVSPEPVAVQIIEEMIDQHQRAQPDLAA